MTFLLYEAPQQSHIIIPEKAYIPDKTKKALTRFTDCGGIVSDNLSDISPVIQTDGTGLRAMHRKTDNADIFILFNESEECNEYRVTLPSQNGYLLDLESGKLQYLQCKNGILNVSLANGETAVILLTDEKYDAENKKEFKSRFGITSGFIFRKEKELVCNENGFDNISHSDETLPVTLGDWSALLGSAYSGSGIYETEFTLPSEKIGKEGEIDLGDVRYTAGVYINGRLLGSVIAPPYRLKIPADLLAEKNTLKIVVTNTSANWYLHTDYFDKWSIKELSPYFEKRSKAFDSSGISNILCSKK